MTTKLLGVSLWAAWFLLVGCGESNSVPLGQVQGTITVDGQPLDGAEITFEPANGRPSVGMTDDAGHYFLEYTMEKRGAVLGSHVVRIRGARNASGGEGDGPQVAARKENLPAKYHTASELTAEVNKGKNVIDFDLVTN